MSDSSCSLTARAGSLFTSEASTLSMVGSVANVGQINQSSIQKEVRGTAQAKARRGGRTRGTC